MPIAPKQVAEPRHRNRPARGTPTSWAVKASVSTRIHDGLSVALLHPRSPAPATAVRAPRAGDDRRRRERAALHALRRLPATGGPRTRDGRGAARARGP